MTNEELIEKIRRGEIDYNNQSLFFKILIRGLLYHLRQDIRIRGQEVPHYIINTGDETMMLEVKGQDQSKEPLDISNENYIYTIIPRCAVTPKGISLTTDELTSPYANGISQFEYEDNIISLHSEFRRLPLKMSFDLTYLLDTYTDQLELTQQIITKLAFIQNFVITYMGQEINCSYSIPESMDGENTVEFDETSQDDRRYKMSISIEVETNLPIFDVKTIKSSDNYIRKITTSYSVYTKAEGETLPNNGSSMGLKIYTRGQMPDGQYDDYINET